MHVHCTCNFSPFQLKEKEILTTAAQGGDPSLELPLNDTPSTVLVSATHESNFTLFCDEKVTFLPRRKLDFVGQPLLNPSHHFGEGASMLLLLVCVEFSASTQIYLIYNSCTHTL